MIDFTFTEEQEMFRKAAREFAETMVASKVPEMEETGKFSDDLVKALGEAEMMALTVPEEYGGLDLGYTVRMIAIEEISKVSVAVGMMLQVCALGIEPILKFGTEEQKKRYLPAMAKGERIGTTAVTEATGGSDPTGIRTSYKKEGSDYILNGRKCFITNSHIGDTITILAKDSENPKAFSTFIMEKGMEGFKATREEHKVGMRGCNTGELALENCRVPAENLIGDEGKGMRVALAAIGDVGRGGMVGCALGLQAACLEAGQLLGYRATSMQDKGMRSSNEFAVAKYFTTEAAQRAAKMAVDIHGGYGCMEEYAVSRYLRDSFVLGPSAGTSDIMKVIIGRWALS
jgi:alkylation response protein AidB-like acyl-CoA dehydrogenase